MDQLLNELLDRELDWSPRARGPYISHFAMGLVAARRLGASDDELRDHFEDVAGDDFSVARDRPAWLGPDTERITSDGIAAEVRRRLPGLLDDLDAQFFHAVIRLELAIDAGHAGQVANALANWEHDVTTEDGERKGHAASGATDPVDALDELARLAAVAHAEADNFATLHLVTGTRAIVAMAPFVDEQDHDRLVHSARRDVQAVLEDLAHRDGVLTEIGTPAAVERRAEELRSTPTPGWGELGAAARRSGDVHTMKLVYACRLQEERTGDELFRAVAARQVAG